MLTFYIGNFVNLIALCTGIFLCRLTKFKLNSNIVYIQEVLNMTIELCCTIECLVYGLLLLLLLLKKVSNARLGESD